MKFKKVVAAVMAVAAFAGVLAGCGKKDDNKFVVGFDQDFPPMGFVADDGSYTGFDLELAKEAASRMGKEFVAQPIAWDSKDQELATGNI
ncbi:MAG: transporter substrate-binding domain-containing protein, partial [Lachnospiraceae bacterium]|nr:transporter substrate-binding domain-containing protein [Lachnospiraceae bacterium]